MSFAPDLATVLSMREQHFVFERHCHAAVIGDSAAGPVAALQLARQRRSVIVVDFPRPCNASAAVRNLGRPGHWGAQEAEGGEAL